MVSNVSDNLAHRGKRELVRTMREINNYLDAYIKLSTRLAAELVKVAPRNEIFGDGTITEAFMKKILGTAKMTVEQYLESCRPAKAKKGLFSFFGRIFKHEKTDKSKDL